MILIETPTAGICDYIGNANLNEELKKVEEKKIEEQESEEDAAVVETDVDTTALAENLDITMLKRMAIYETAATYLNTLEYEYGAKPDILFAYGLRNTLDCSGFTWLVYMSSLYIDIGEGTWNQAHNGREIAEEELQIGDLGFMYIPEDTIIETSGENGEGAEVLINHVGIYMGKDENGSNLWCHLNSEDNQVVINNVDYFTHFRTYLTDIVEPIETEEIEETEDTEVEECLYE